LTLKKNLALGEAIRNTQLSLQYNTSPCIAQDIQTDSQCRLMLSLWNIHTLT